MSTDRRQPIQSDPLAAIGSELVAAARRQRSGRRRRRLLATVATTVGLLTASGGALAITDNETGVPVIDRWLDTTHEPHPPVPGSLGDPFEITVRGKASAVAVGYQSRRQGMICSALFKTDERARDARGGTSCFSSRLLAKELARRPARLVGAGGFLPGDGGPPVSVVSGLAREDVRRLFAVLPGGGRVEATVSDPWVPGTWKGGPLRAFLVVVDRAPTGRQAFRLSTPTRLEAELTNGRTVTFR